MTLTLNAGVLKNKIMKQETPVQKIVNHFFYTKGYTLDQIKEDAKKQKIIYSRFVRPANDLLNISGSVEKAKEAITIVADWANSRGLDYTIETVFKKWLELDSLKPKEKKKVPFYNGQKMFYSTLKKKWFVVSEYGENLEYAGEEKDIEWREI